MKSRKNSVQANPVKIIEIDPFLESFKERHFLNLPQPLPSDRTLSDLVHILNSGQGRLERLLAEDIANGRAMSYTGMGRNGKPTIYYRFLNPTNGHKKK